MNTEAVEFVLRLKDYMSGGLQKVAGTAQSSFRHVDTSIARTIRNIKNSTPSIDQMNAKLNELTKKRNLSVDTSEIRRANREIDLLQRNIDRLEGGGIGAGAGRSRRGFSLPSLGGVARVAAMAGGLALTAGIGGLAYAGNAGLQGGAQKMSFQVLAGDKEGEQLYKDLTKYAQQSIFGNEVYKNAQMQMAYGAPAKEVMGTSKMLGDISMGDKGRLESLTLAYSQARANGRLTGQDNLQFVNAGFNPLQQISVMTGKKLPELRKEMEKGNITFEMVKKSFEAATSAGGKFYKMTDRIAATPFGKVEAMKGQVQGIALQAGSIMQPVIGQAIDKIIGPALASIERQVEPVMQTIIADAKEMWPHVRDLVGTVGDMAKPIIDTLRSSEFKDLGKSVIDLTTTIGKDLTPALHIVGSLAKVVAKVLTPIIGTVDNILSPGSQPGFQQAAKGVMAYRLEQHVTDSIMGPYKEARRARVLAGEPSDWRRNRREEDSLKGIIKGALQPRGDKSNSMGQIAQGLLAYGATAGSTAHGTIPAVSAKTAATTSAGSDWGSLGSGASGITKGGPRSITLNFHAPLNQSTYNVEGTAEAIHKGSDDVVEQLMRVLNGFGAVKEE